MAGLIINDSLDYLYSKVTIGRSLEVDTAKLWMAIFNHPFPASDQVYVVQEVPPVSGSHKRVDATIYKVVKKGGVWEQRNLVYVEFKRHGLTGRQLKHAVEQVDNYCKSLVCNEHTTSIMAMVCHGQDVGIWQVRKDSSIPKEVGFVDAKTGDLGKFRALVHRLTPQGSTSPYRGGSTATRYGGRDSQMDSSA